MLELKEISKKYEDKVLFQDFSLNIKEGEFVAITGQSGSGKSTLLNIMGLLERPDTGTVSIHGYQNPKQKVTEKLRRFHLGYIFQNYALLENESVKRNLLFAVKFNKEFNESMLPKVLEEVHLDGEMLNQKVYQLSGGEQQRLAIARILLKPCNIILADEPTGNLDEANKKMIVDLLKKLKEKGKTIICVTHDLEMAEAADRIVEIDSRIHNKGAGTD